MWNRRLTTGYIQSIVKEIKERPDLFDWNTFYRSLQGDYDDGHQNSATIIDDLYNRWPNVLSEMKQGV
jgi:hypothetical protein